MQIARVHVLLQREGWDANYKKVHRIYNELGRQLRNKTAKRRVKARLRDDRVPANGTQDVWAMDFAHNQLAASAKIRTLTVIDAYSRYAHVVDARFSYRAENVVAALKRVRNEIGYPRMIRVDQGSESFSAASPSNPSALRLPDTWQFDRRF